MKGYRIVMCWVVKRGEFYWTGPHLNAWTVHPRKACRFSSRESASTFAKSNKAKVFARTKDGGVF